MGTVQDRADARLSEALRETGARDPRELYRELLRTLKQSSAERYGEAVGYFRDTLLPGVAAEGSDPLALWLEYGTRLAEWIAPGRRVAIDETGRAGPCPAPIPLSVLVLHLPEAGGRAIPIALPADPSLPQRATWDLLVEGRQKRS